MNINWAYAEIANRECALCELHETCETVCLVGQGPKNARAMVIGEAPGAREDSPDIRRPFAGQAGGRLDKELEKHGISREELYITNVIKCRPPENRDPTPEECKACQTYLNAEISAIEPRLMLLLGRYAIKAVLGQTSVLGARPGVHERDGAQIIATYHPASLFHNPKLEPYFEEDIARFARLFNGEKVMPDPEYVLVRNMDGLRQCIRDVKENKDAFSYDTETSGLETWTQTDKMWCIGIGVSPNKAYIIPWEHPEHTWSQSHKEQIIKTLTFFFNLKRHRIAQNGQFDNRWLRDILGIVNANHTWDTMIAAHLLNENLRVGLKPQASRLLGVELYEIKVNTKEGVTPLEELAKYCAKDVCYTYAIRDIQRPQIAKDEALARVFKFLLMPAAQVISKVESTGVWVDKARLEERTKTTEKEKKRRVEKLKKYLPTNLSRDVNWNSTHFVRYMLYDYLKLPILEYTKDERGESTETPSTAEPIIRQLKGKHPIVSDLLEYREQNSRLIKFLYPWAEWCKYDGRLHSHYKLAGPATGRLATSDPNIQQTDRSNFIRSILGAMPGWVIIGIDLVQAEMVIAAMLSRDPELMNVFLTGQDVHVATAVQIMGKKPEEVTKADRKKAKPVNFGLIYKLSWRGLQRYAREKFDTYYTDEEAQAYHAAFFKKYSGLLAWHSRQEALVKEMGYVRSPLGRIRHLPDIHSSSKSVQAEAGRQAINAPVQALGSDIPLFAATLLDKEINPEECRLIILFHDALYYECREDKVEHHKALIKETVENLPLEEYFGFRPTLPIKADVEIYAHWRGIDVNSTK